MANGYDSISRKDEMTYKNQQWPPSSPLSYHYAGELKNKDALYAHRSPEAVTASIVPYTNHQPPRLSEGLMTSNTGGSVQEIWNTELSSSRPQKKARLQYSQLETSSEKLGLPPLDTAVVHPRRPPSPGLAHADSMSLAGSHWFAASAQHLGSDQRRDGRHIGLLAPPSHRLTERSLPPILIPDGSKRDQTYDRPGWSMVSPYPLSSASMSVPGHSPPNPTNSARTLPSPAPTVLTTYAPSSRVQSDRCSPISTESAHISHLQDLQHQLSTKLIALQTLQKEHEQLLAAFSRSQIRCVALEKKSHVSDHEINSLLEEKSRTQQEVDTLEMRVEGLVKARDELQKQSTADAAQWQRIMSMSSQLQSKGADDLRRFDADRQMWQSERDDYQARIQQLEGRLTTSAPHTIDGLPLSPHDGSVAPLPAISRHEVNSLKRRCTELEKFIQGLSDDTDPLEQAIRVMKSVRDRLSAKTHAT